MKAMAKRTASVLITLIMLVSLFPAAVFAGDADRNGWVKEEGCWYYYKNDERVTGWLKSGGKWYYLSAENGGRMVDWPAEVIGGKRYVFNNDGSLVSKKGWVTIKYYGYDNLFYVTDGGIAPMDYGWHKISGKWYFFLEYGYVLTEDWVPDGIEIEGKMCYFNKDGSWRCKCWVSKDGKWYYYDGDGQPAKGWMKIGKKWYYFGSDKVMYSGTWLRDPDSGEWYYFDKSGAMATNRWAEDVGNWFYQGKDGKSVRGWLKLNKKWYYLDPESYGACVMNTTMEIGGKTYKFDKNGVCKNP